MPKRLLPLTLADLVLVRVLPTSDQVTIMCRSRAVSRLLLTDPERIHVEWLAELSSALATVRDLACHVGMLLLARDAGKLAL